MALEDGGSAVALRSDIGRGLTIAAVALGSGGGRRTWDNGVGVDFGINVVKANCILLQCWISVDKDGKRGHIQCEGRTLMVMARR